MKKIVITGATGMIGCALTKAAIQSGIEVLAVVRPHSKNIKNLPNSPLLKITECDISAYEKLTTDSDYDVFFHLAWNQTFGESREDTEIQVQNIQYTLSAVRLAKKLGCTKFVGAGSQAEYGHTEQKLKEATPADPQSGYGIGKYSAGKLSRILCNQLGMAHCWTRILSVYGELDSPKTLIMYLVSALSKGEKPSLTKCDQIWDYMYCGDAADALIAIGEKGVHGRIYCLGSGQARPLREYVCDVRDCINPSLPLGFGEKPYYSHQAMYLCADITDLQQDTGFTPKTAFKEGIRSVIHQYKNSSSIT